MRSSIRFDGVTVGETAPYGGLNQARTGNGLNAKPSGTLNVQGRGDEQGTRSTRRPASPVPGGSPIAPPRFVSEASFMDFRFGARQLLPRRPRAARRRRGASDGGHIPQNLFHEAEDERRKRRGMLRRRTPRTTRHKRKSRARKRRSNDKEAKLEQDIERKMNKTALVSLWDRYRNTK